MSPLLQPSVFGIFSSVSESPAMLCCDNISSVSHAQFTKANAGAILATLGVAILSACSAFVILGHVDAQASCDRRKAGLPLLAAITLTVGSWSAHLTSLGTSLASIYSHKDRWLLTFDVGFILLSLIIPLLVNCIALLLVVYGSGRQNHLWSHLLAGAFIGISFGFMQCSVFFTLPYLNVHLNVVKTAMSLALGVLVSVLSFVAVWLTRSRWPFAASLRIAAPLLLGCGICGMDFLAIGGTSFLPKNVVNVELKEHSALWKALTIVIPGVCAVVLGLGLAFAFMATVFRRALMELPSPQLRIASVSFASNGSVLVKEDGTLPTQIVNLHGLDKNVLQEFKPNGGMFRWLFTLSFSWKVITPFVDRIESYSLASQRRGILDNLRAVSRIFKRRPEHFTSSLESEMKIRMIEATVQLANQLDIPVQKLGYLYDRTLTTGTQVNLAEFLSLAEKEPESHNLERAVAAAAAGAHEGLMLFFVRHLPQTATTPEDDWARKYSRHGYNLSFLRHFRKPLAESVGATQHDVDKILVGCKDYVETGTKPVVQPDGAYVALSVLRTAADGLQGVLVYEFARHQVPAYRLDLSRFTSEMRDWVRNAAGISIGELLHICQTDIALEPDRLRLSISTYGSSVRSAPSLIDFVDALAQATEELLSALHFIPNLRRNARLSPQLLDVPTSHGRPAHLIVLKVDISDLPTAPPTATRNCHDFYTRIPCLATPPLPPAFVYTPKSLYDAAQTVLSHTTDTFRRQTAHEIDRLFPSPSSALHTSEDAYYPPSHRPALVSTFSIDTVSDAQSARALRPQFSLTSLRSWASTAVTTALPTGRLRSVSHPEPLVSPSSMHTIREDGTGSGSGRVGQGPRRLRRAVTRGRFERVGPGRHEGRIAEGGVASRHPYLHLRLPPPLVFANHPFATAMNASCSSLSSSGDGGRTVESAARSGVYQLNNEMERADAWFRRM